MSNPYPHEDQDQFKMAIESTQSKTNFSPLLIEKDYYCSLVLEQLYLNTENEIIFKGGTLLNKVHAGFYRLSEDLDFSIPVDSQASRRVRSNKVKPFKPLLERMGKDIPMLSISKPLSGLNNSTQYNAELTYDSILSSSKGIILFEIGLRDEPLESTIKAKAATLIQNPFTDLSLKEPFDVLCLSKKESYAEKFRAALSREKPAIRDIFDMHFGLQNDLISMDDENFTELVKTKLNSPKLCKIDVSKERKQIFLSQLDQMLRPVLRANDFSKFDFELAWRKLLTVAERFK